jgi:hypothetical protein
MYLRKTIEKAKLVDLDKSANSFKFQFNPETLEITRGCMFEDGDGQNQNNWAGLKAKGAQVDTMSTTFILDTTEPDLFDGKAMLNMMNPIIVSSPTLKPADKAMPLLPANKDDVREIIHKLFVMTMILDPEDDNKRRPHLVKFEWKKILFVGGITDLSFKYTLFDSDGIPKRAEVNLTIKGRYCIEGTKSIPKPHDNLVQADPKNSKASSTVNV